MARDPETIEREIEQARTALTATLDQLGTKANPQKLADQAKNGIRAKLDNPKVKYPLIGVGALILALLVRKLFR
ncbi:DUF3618 domain-containing protein [Amycolatopsis sp. NPDC005232]|uniref:DUF3618 domain-containing protein n=1 Tax=unclassified Amycolatopsis TaxID=2618356 RepID=UPI001C699502|nr:DUF3618 domain-containing protein [Amycolatopsis sp. DSM 110486]QYN22477.1 DUF3618 domain-containing protein [Amycolatopsis sp. DSM 110486]